MEEREEIYIRRNFLELVLEVRGAHVRSGDDPCPAPRRSAPVPIPLRTKTGNSLSLVPRPPSGLSLDPNSLLEPLRRLLPPERDLEELVLLLDLLFELGLNGNADEEWVVAGGNVCVSSGVVGGGLGEAG